MNRFFFYQINKQLNRTFTVTTRRLLSACFIGSAVRRSASVTALAATAAAVSHRCRPAAAEGRGGVKPRLTSWGSVGAESGSLVGHRTSGSHLEQGGGGGGGCLERDRASTRV